MKKKIHIGFLGNYIYKHRYFKKKKNLRYHLQLWKGGCKNLKNHTSLDKNYIMMRLFHLWLFMYVEDINEN